MKSSRPKYFRQLRRLFRPDEIIFDPRTLKQYAGDKWYAAHQPDVVARPRNAASVSRLLRFAHQHRIPVTPRGGGHGYVGGCVPVRGGIVLSLERMNRIREINADDFVAVVQAGVNTQRLQDEVEMLGLHYPPDASSRSNNFIGGNIATHAGGPRWLDVGCTWG